MSRMRVRTEKREQLVDITDRVEQVIEQAAVTDGVIHLWSMHTTCGLTVNEGHDPDVARDIVTHLAKLAPKQGDWRHAEGNSDAHVKTLLAGPGLTLLIENGRLVLGTWQRVFLCEWDGPRSREIAYVVRP